MKGRSDDSNIKFYVYIGDLKEKVDFDLVYGTNVTETCKQLNCKNFLIESEKIIRINNQEYIQRSIFSLFTNDKNLTFESVMEKYIRDNFRNFSNVKNFIRYVFCKDIVRNIVM